MTKFEKIEQKVKQIISKEFPLWYVERTITYKKSHTVWACGDTQLWRNIPIAVVRLSSRYDQSDNNTLVHELIHACLPFGEKHKNKFQKVCEYIELYTDWEPRKEVLQTATPKYQIKYFEEDNPIPVFTKELYRANKVIKYLIANGGKYKTTIGGTEYTVILKVVR